MALGSSVYFLNVVRALSKNANCIVRSVNTFRDEAAIRYVRTAKGIGIHDAHFETPSGTVFASSHTRRLVEEILGWC